MAGGGAEDIPMQPSDKSLHNSRPFVVFSKKLFIIAVIVIVALVVLVGVLSGVISANYAEKRVRRELLADKEKREEPGIATTSGPIATSEPTGPEPWYNVRLPSDVMPIHYDVFLHPNLTTETFQGNVSVVIDVNKPTEYILIHINEMNITKSSLHKAQEQGDAFVAGDELAVKERMSYMKNYYYVFILASKLDTGKYVIKMSYEAYLTTTLNGLYLSTYVDSKLGKRKLATTKFEPTDARKALPCFDEPAMKATFTTTIVHEKDYTALSNMPEESNITLPSGHVQTRFQKSVKMSTYLLAFIVCDFAHKSNMTGIHGNTTVRVWTTRDQIDQTEYALSVASKIITYFEKYYKVNYPLPKQDLIAIPDFSSGAMENWGLITFRETRLLYQPGVSSESAKQVVALVISHELAHQWFGNIVSPKWWNDLWLNEGFASYVEYIGVEHVHPDWGMMEQFLLLDLQLVFPLDSLATSHPISVEVDHPKKIKQIFDRISYSKGSSIIRMLAGFLGRDKFTEGLQHYLKTFEFKNAEMKDLWNALATMSNTDVKTIMDTWTLQMGYPMVTVTKQGNKAVVTQKHFLLDPSSNVTEASPFNYKWYVPFSFITSKVADPTTVWMNMSSVEFSWPEGNWIKGNYKQIGYYRVHYDEDNWKALSEQLRTNHLVFTSEDRSSLIDDAFSLARAGHLKYSTALNMLSYLSNETSYVPWKTALNRLGYLGTVLANRPSYGNYKKFIRNKVRPHVDRLGWDMQPSDSHIEKFMRVTLLRTACSKGDEQANQNVKNIFLEWKNGTRKNIDVNLKSMVYSYGIANTGEDEWEWMFDRFLKTADASEKSTIMSALGASNQPWILNKFLDSSLDPKLIRSQDMVSVIRSVSYNSVGKYLAWNFARANWYTILKVFGTSTFRMTSLVNGITHGFNSEFDLKEMIHFFDTSIAGTSESARKQAIERTKANIAWLKNNEVEVETWLKTNA